MSDRPNIVHFHVDDLGYGELGGTAYSGGCTARFRAKSGCKAVSLKQFAKRRFALASIHDTHEKTTEEVRNMFE